MAGKKYHCDICMLGSKSNRPHTFDSKEEFLEHYNKYPSIHKRPCREIMSVTDCNNGGSSSKDASSGRKKSPNAKRVGGRPDSSTPRKRLKSSTGSDEFTDSFAGGDIGTVGGKPSDAADDGTLGTKDGNVSMQGSDANDSGTTDDAILAMTLAVSTFKTISGKDVVFDMKKVDHVGHGLHRLFFQHFQDLPWSTSYFKQYGKLAMKEKLKLQFITNKAKEVLGCDAALFLRLVNNVDSIIKKFDSLNSIELNNREINRVEKATDDYKKVLATVMQDTKFASFRDRIEDINTDAKKQIMSSGIKNQYKIKALNKIRAEISKQCRALIFSIGHSRTVDTIVSQFIALFDIWTIVRQDEPEVSDAADDLEPRQGTSTEAAATKHDHLKVTPEMIDFFNNFTGRVPGMVQSMNRGNTRGFNQRRGNVINDCDDNDCLIFHCIELYRKRSVYFQQLDSKSKSILIHGSMANVHKTFGPIDNNVLRLLRANKSCMIDTILDIFDYSILTSSSEGKKDSVHNLTDIVLHDTQLELLSFGSTFICTPDRVTKEELCIVFDELKFRTLRKYMFKGVSKSKLLKERSKAIEVDYSKIASSDSYMDLIKSLVDPMALTESVLHDMKSIKPNLSIREKEGLDELRKLIHEKDLILLESDKNMGICLIDRKGYHDRIFNELNKLDKSFQVTDLTVSDQEKLIDESVQLRQCINALIRKHFNQSRHKSYLTRYLNNVPKAILPVIRGMPKLHKDGERMRIILPFHQNIFTQIHNVIAAVLTPLAQRIKTALISSLELIADLEPQTFDGNFYLVSADLDSMYNRIDLKVAVDLIIDFMHENKEEFLIFGNNQLTNDWTWRNVIMKSFEKCIFQFSDKLIQQSYGVAMGSPAGPLIATIYINRIIMKNILQDSNDFTMIKYWRMYIDDGIFVFDASKSPEAIKQILNDLIAYNGSELKWDDKSIHIKRINTLMTDPLIFLDTQIGSHAGEQGLYQLLFSVYCKPIGSYQYIHRRSCHDISCMKSIAYAEALRRLRLSTRQVDYEHSLNDLRKKLMRRGHRLSDINQQLTKVPFSLRQTAMQGTLHKFSLKRDPSLNINPLKRERKEEISTIIPIILRFDPSIVTAVKKVKHNLESKLRLLLINKQPFGQIRLILAWKKNKTMINQIMASKRKKVERKKIPFLSNPEND